MVRAHFPKNNQGDSLICPKARLTVKAWFKTWLAALFLGQKSLGKMMKFSPVQKERQQWNWILPAECRIRMLVA